jgi:hypothetical protein
VTVNIRQDVFEATEKAPEQILGRDAEKRDFLEWIRINDLMLGKS